MDRNERRCEVLQEHHNRIKYRQRKRMLQFMGVGFFMFLIGVYVGNVYADASRARAEKNADKETEIEVSGEVITGLSAVEEEQITADTQLKSSQDEELQEKAGTEQDSGKDTGKESEESEKLSGESEEEMLPEENLPTDWNLLLVNATHTLPEDFEVELGEIGSGHKIDVRAVEDFKAMVQAAKKDGATVYVVSSYRTLEKQMELHHNKIEEYVEDGYSYQAAQEEAATVVAIPGTSEHQLGLAVDMISAEYKKLDEKQENTKGFQWLKEHSWEYGFILRYPNGKTDITGIIYEPWHFRYVGKEAAREITLLGITLEEYVGANPVSAVLGKGE